VVVAALIVVAGVIGFDLIMRLQVWITIITGVLTVIYIILAVPHINLATVGALPTGAGQAVIGALVFVMTGFGLGWVNAAADYSRYLPRGSRSSSVIGWTTWEIWKKATMVTSTKWSIRTPVFASTVLTVQAAPPMEKAALNMSNPPAAVPPLAVGHSGRCTIESRGMLMP